MQEKVAFIGYGNMANAIISAVLNSDCINKKDLYIYDLNAEKLNKAKELNINTIGSIKESAICKYVFICVKPQNINEVLNELKETVNENNINDKVFVSIAAGIKTEYILSFLGKNAKLIRIMPNVCLMQNEGASALTAHNTTEDEFDFVFKIFNSCGTAVKTDEKNFDAVTALSGSGPAFCFEFVNEMINAAEKCGLSRKEAEVLAIQTMYGSAKMLKFGDKSADELIKMVSSPNGTTVAGLEAMRKNNFKKSVESAIVFANNRSVELGNK